MELIKIQSNKVASKRTRERVREHGPEFEIVERKPSVACFEDNLGPFVLVKSPKTKWLGWIPVSEFIVVE